jgi:PilZ domain-containing protein
VSDEDGSGRASERVGLPATLHGEVLMFQRMDIRQLSVEGALIETAFPLTVDSVHAFRLTLDEGPVVVKGRVAHSHIAEVDLDAVVYHSGIEFVAMTPPVARTLSAFLKRVKRARDD